MDMQIMEVCRSLRNRVIYRQGLQRWAVAALATVALYIAPSAYALDIVLTDIGGSPMTPAQFAAFDQAAKLLEARFTDPITVYIAVAWDDPDAFSNPNVIASTSIARTTHALSAVLTAMALDATLNLEKNTVQMVPQPLPVELSGGVLTTRSQVTMSTANAKALNLSWTRDLLYSQPPAGYDALIRYNNTYFDDFDLDRSDGMIDPTRKDFIGVTAHEMGHALGFFSVTDVQDANPTFTLQPNTLDLYRFTRTGVAHNFPFEERLITAGFADHDHKSTVYPMSAGVNLFDPDCNTGDGRCQASHWRDDQEFLMDPTLADGVQVDLSLPDRFALDYLGYDHKIFSANLWHLLKLRTMVIPSIPNPCVDCPPFPDWLPPDPITDWEPGRWAANLRSYLVLDLEPPLAADWGAVRSFSGGLNLVEAKLYEGDQVTGFANRPDWENEEGGTLYGAEPAMICGMDFVSDMVTGPQLRLTQFGGCVPFDTTIGTFGGFRVTLCLRPATSATPEQCAGQITVNLALTSNTRPSLATFAAGVEAELDDSADNMAKVVDAEAVGLTDSDGDRLPDVGDNCPTLANADQCDTDRDGAGNRCDPDFNNDGVLDFFDFGIFKAGFAASEGDARFNADTDYNCDGRTDFTDFALFKPDFLDANQPPR